MKNLLQSYCLWLYVVSIAASQAPPSWSSPSNVDKDEHRWTRTLAGSVSPRLSLFDNWPPDSCVDAPTSSCCAAFTAVQELMQNQSSTCGQQLPRLLKTSENSIIDASMVQAMCDADTGCYKDLQPLFLQTVNVTEPGCVDYHLSLGLLDDLICSQGVVNSVFQAQVPSANSTASKAVTAGVMPARPSMDTGTQWCFEAAHTFHRLGWLLFASATAEIAWPVTTEEELSRLCQSCVSVISDAISHRWSLTLAASPAAIDGVFEVRRAINHQHITMQAACSRHPQTNQHCLMHPDMGNIFKATETEHYDELQRLCDWCSRYLLHTATVYSDVFIQPIAPMWDLDFESMVSSSCGLNKGASCSTQLDDAGILAQYGVAMPICGNVFRNQTTGCSAECANLMRELLDEHGCCAKPVMRVLAPLFFIPESALSNEGLLRMGAQCKLDMPLWCDDRVQNEPVVLRFKVGGFAQPVPVLSQADTTALEAALRADLRLTTGLNSDFLTAMEFAIRPVVAAGNQELAYLLAGPNASRPGDPALAALHVNVTVVGNTIQEGYEMQNKLAQLIVTGGLILAHLLRFGEDRGLLAPPQQRIAIDVNTHIDSISNSTTASSISPSSSNVLGSGLHRHLQRATTSRSYVHTSVQFATVDETPACRFANGSIDFGCTARARGLGASAQGGDGAQDNGPILVGVFVGCLCLLVIVSVGWYITHYHRQQKLKAAYHVRPGSHDGSVSADMETISKGPYTVKCTETFDTHSAHTDPSTDPYKPQHGVSEVPQQVSGEPSTPRYSTPPPTEPSPPRYSGPEDDSFGRYHAGFPSSYRGGNYAGPSLGPSIVDSPSMGMGDNTFRTYTESSYYHPTTVRSHLATARPARPEHVAEHSSELVDI